MNRDIIDINDFTILVEEAKVKQAIVASYFSQRSSYGCFTEMVVRWMMY